MSGLSRSSHYVPRSYLKRWSPDKGANVWAYPILVSHSAVPLWRFCSTKGIAVRRDLYTSVAQGKESDRIERWLNEEVETPAHPILERLAAGQSLKPEERTRVARYIAALNVRSPVYYSEHTERVSQHLGSVLNSVVENTLDRIGKSLEAGQSIETPPFEENSRPFSSVSVKINRPDLVTDSTEIEDISVDRRPSVEINVVIGRESWLDSIEHVVDHTSKMLEDHDWSVIQPHRGWAWRTSDNPVLRLNYYTDRTYDFGGGYANPGSEILLPLSPSQLLYTQVGKPSGLQGQVSIEHTYLINRLIAENGFRWIVSDSPARSVEWVRPRTVDVNRYKSEEEAWTQFHDEQTKAELENQEKRGE